MSPGNMGLVPTVLLTVGGGEPAKLSLVWPDPRVPPGGFKSSPRHERRARKQLRKRLHRIQLEYRAAIARIRDEGREREEAWRVHREAVRRFEEAHQGPPRPMGVDRLGVPLADRVPRFFQVQHACGYRDVGMREEHCELTPDQWAYVERWNDPAPDRV